MLREVMDVLEFLEDARNGAEPFAALLSDGPQSVEITPFESDIGKTDFIKILFPGTSGKSGGGDAPTIGIIGLEWRPAPPGRVSWARLRRRWLHCRPVRGFAVGADANARSTAGGRCLDLDACLSASAPCTPRPVPFRHVSAAQ